MHNVQSILHCVLMYYVHSYEGGRRAFVGIGCISLQRRLDPLALFNEPYINNDYFDAYIPTHTDSIERCEQMKWQEDERIQFYLQQFSINHVLLIHNSVLQRRFAYHISSLKHICKLGTCVQHAYNNKYEVTKESSHTAVMVAMALYTIV